MLSQAGNVCGYERREFSESPGETGDLNAESVKVNSRGQRPRAAIQNGSDPARVKASSTLSGSD